MLKYFLREISCVSTPSYHNNFNSSNKACKYTPILLFLLLRPGMKQFKNKYGLVIHILGEKSYGVRNTSQQEYDAAPTKKGVKLSAHNLTFLGSADKSG